MQKWLALLAVGQGIYAKWLYRRLLLGAIVLVSLAIITSIMIGAMLVIGFYAVYFYLAQSGMDQAHILYLMGGLITCVTVICALMTIACLQRLKQLPTQLLMEKAPHLAQANGVVDAFFHGLMGLKEK